MEIKLEEYFDHQQLSQVGDLFIRNQDRVFLSEKVKNTEALLISVFMISNKVKKAAIPRKEAEKLYFLLGRERKDFRKILFELSKKKILEYGDLHIMLLPKGLNLISKVLGKIQKTNVLIVKSGENFSAVGEFEKFLEGGGG